MQTAWANGSKLEFYVTHLDLTVRGGGGSHHSGEENEDYLLRWGYTGRRRCSRLPACRWAGALYEELERGEMAAGDFLVMRNGLNRCQVSAEVSEFLLRDFPVRSRAPVISRSHKVDANFSPRAREVFGSPGSAKWNVPPHTCSTLLRESCDAEKRKCVKIQTLVSCISACGKLLRKEPNEPRM
jgi:hypothetical protein